MTVLSIRGWWTDKIQRFFGTLSEFRFRNLVRSMFSTSFSSAISLACLR